MASSSSANCILLVEDDPNDVEIITRTLALSKSGFSLECRQRLSSGLAHLAGPGASLVLLDLHLPDSHGIETFATMHQAHPNLPVIVLTGLDDSELALEAVGRGAQDYLSKDQITPALLVRSISYALERTRVTSALYNSNRRLRILSACNQAIARSSEEPALLAEVCRIACQIAGLPLAWVGYAMPEGVPSIKLMAQSGLSENNVQTFRILSERRALGELPVGEAIRAGQTVAHSLPLGPTELDPWQGICVECGLRALISLPLKSSATGQAFGALTLAAGQLTDFTEQEAALWEEIAANLAYGISVLREREERRKEKDELAWQAKELTRSNAELKRFNRLAVGRELRMIELKQQVNELAQQLGQTPPYSLEFVQATGEMSAHGQRSNGTESET